jgi:hypothetical protein
MADVFLDRLNPRDQKLISIYKTFLAAGQDLVRANVEAEQLGFYSAGEETETLHSSEPETTTRQRAPRSQKEASRLYLSRTQKRSAAGVKAAQTRLSNKRASTSTKTAKVTVKTSKRTSKSSKRGSSRGDVAFYDTDEQTSPRKKWSDSEIRETLLKVITENPDKYTMKQLRKIVPCDYTRLVCVRDQLVLDGKIVHKGMTRNRADGVRYCGTWSLA